MIEKQNRDLFLMCLIFFLAPVVICGFTTINLQKKTSDNDFALINKEGILAVVAHFWSEDNSFVTLLVANNGTAQVFISEIRVNGTVFPTHYMIEPHSDLLIEIKGKEAFVSQVIYEFCLITTDYKMCKYFAMAL